MTVSPLLVAVAHGSHDRDSVAVVHRLAELAGQLRPGCELTVAFVDDASPSVGAVLAALAGRPAVVVPLLVSAAAHSKTDIAASVRLARQAGAVISYGRPFGVDPAVLTAVSDRLAEAGVAASAPVVLAAAGSADPAANADVCALARLLSESRDLAPVEPAFAGATAPTVGQAIDKLERLGHRRSDIGVARLFIGPGRLPGAVAAAAAGTRVAGVLGAHPALAALLLNRFDEAQAGDIRMNCDVCVYRVALPGSPDSVGAPQVPHRHSDDA